MLRSLWSHCCNSPSFYSLNFPSNCVFVSSEPSLVLSLSLSPTRIRNSIAENRLSIHLNIFRRHRTSNNFERLFSNLRTSICRESGGENHLCKFGISERTTENAFSCHSFSISNQAEGSRKRASGISIAYSCTPARWGRIC